jgi:cytosine/adenosine deaminase-related metal-dependent hydrolase
MLAEARQAMLLQRVGHEAGTMGARAALEIATRGGAEVLGRDDIGAIEPGRAADIVAFRVDGIGFAGALHDPVAALVFCAPTGCAFSMIDGRVVVRGGELQTVEVPRLVQRHNALATVLAR